MQGIGLTYQIIRYLSVCLQKDSAFSELVASDVKSYVY